MNSLNSMKHYGKTPLKGASKAASRDSVGTVSLEIGRMKTLIREMTHHEPENRPSAAHIRMNLEQIQLQVSFHWKQMWGSV